MWETVWCNKNKVWYYRDSVSGNSSWQIPPGCNLDARHKPPPEELSVQDPAPKAPKHWECFWDEVEKKHYFHHIKTGERRWINPANAPGAHMEHELHVEAVHACHPFGSVIHEDLETLKKSLHPQKSGGRAKIPGTLAPPVEPLIREGVHRGDLKHGGSTNSSTAESLRLAEAAEGHGTRTGHGSTAYMGSRKSLARRSGRAATRLSRDIAKAFHVENPDEDITSSETETDETDDGADHLHAVERKKAHHERKKATKESRRRTLREVFAWL